MKMPSKSDIVFNTAVIIGKSQRECLVYYREIAHSLGGDWTEESVKEVFKSDPRFDTTSIRALREYVIMDSDFIKLR